jgi:hypothetical protein
MDHKWHKDVMQKKRSLFLLSQNCNDSKLQLYYKHYCLILRKFIKEAKLHYCNKLTVNSENRVKTTWKIIKTLTKKHQHPRQILPPLKIDNREQPPNLISQVFNN